MDAAVMIPILLSLTSLGLWFHGIVSLIKFIVEIKLYNKGNTAQSSRNPLPKITESKQCTALLNSARMAH